MILINNEISKEAKFLNKYVVNFEDELMNVEAYWMRIADSRLESLNMVQHYHSFCEMQYIIEGKIDISIDERDFVLNSGEFVIIPPNVEHKILGYDANTKKFVFGFFIQSENNFVNEAINAFNKICKYAESQDMRSVMEILLKNVVESKPCLDRIIKNYVENFLIATLTAVCNGRHCETGLARKGDGERLSAEMRSYIRRNMETITVSMLAQAFHMSERHLNRICYKTIGKSPREVIDDEKLRYIKLLLATTDYAVNDIATMCGFVSSRTLYHFFVKKENISLLEFRKLSRL